MTVVNTPADQVGGLPPADGIMFFLTHDLMRSRGSLENVLRFAKPGARVVAFGAKTAPWWAFPLNLVVWLVGRRYVTTYEGVRRPWSVLAELIGDVRMKQRAAGCVYYAWGTVT